MQSLVFFTCFFKTCIEEKPLGGGGRLLVKEGLTLISFEMNAITTHQIVTKPQTHKKLARPILHWKKITETQFGKNLVFTWFYKNVLFIQPDLVFLQTI